MNDRLRAAGRAACESRGYTVTAPDKPWLPTELADPTADTTPFVARATTTRVAVEPLDIETVTPTTLLSRLKNNAGNERFSLFVVAREDDARTVHDVLHDPPLVASEDDAGRRTFYNGPDRIPLADGGYAAVRTNTSPADLVWCESGDGDDRSLLLVDGRSEGAGSSTGRLADESDVVACLGAVDDLACPAAETFPYSYRRDPDDKRFQVRTRDGRVVGIYNGVAALRANAYVPLPMPLVPEHLFSGVPSVRDEWAVLVAGDGERDGDESPSRLVTAGTF